MFLKDKLVKEGRGERGEGRGRGERGEGRGERGEGREEGRKRKRMRWRRKEGGVGLPSETTKPRMAARAMTRNRFTGNPNSLLIDMIKSLYHLLASTYISPSPCSLSLSSPILFPPVLSLCVVVAGEGLGNTLPLLTCSSLPISPLLPQFVCRARSTNERWWRCDTPDLFSPTLLSRTSPTPLSLSHILLADPLRGRTGAPAGFEVSLMTPVPSSLPLPSPSLPCHFPLSASLSPIISLYSTLPLCILGAQD